MSATAEQDNLLSSAESGKFNGSDFGSSYQSESAWPSARPSTSPTSGKDGEEGIKRVRYSPSNHVQVIIQMHGSALPQVARFCVVNCVLTLAAYFLREYGVVDVTFESSTGHTFMGLLVSFLVVERSRVSYNRFMQYRELLATTYRCTRELVQLSCAYTFETQTERARQWRQDLAYRALLMLRISMDVLEWASTDVEHWEDKYRDKYPQEAGSVHAHAMRELTHTGRTLVDENFRAPLMFEYELRETIMKHPTYLGYKMHANEYRDLVLMVSTFNQAQHGFRVLTFTPYPFPLVQMTRIFLFFWVYSMPLVLINQFTNIVNTVLMVCLLTLGFVGTEYVSMTLDDPFGTHANDVDHKGMSRLCEEDAYLILYKVDGLKAAKKLRDRMIARSALGRGIDCYHMDVRGSDYWGRETTEKPLTEA